MTVNRPHASRPTPNQPGVHGSKRERRPTGWRHHHAPRPLTTMPTNTTEQRNSTITNAANQRWETALHCTWTDQDATNQRRHGRAGCTNNIRRYDHRQQRDKMHGDQADHEAAKTTAHQPHRSCRRHLTVDRPHASGPTPNGPGVNGSKRERRPSGWQHRGAPCPPTTMAANKTMTLPPRNRPTNVLRLH